MPTSEIVVSHMSDAKFMQVAFGKYAVLGALARYSILGRRNKCVNAKEYRCLFERPKSRGGIGKVTQ